MDATPDAESAVLDVGALLTIDVDAEIRKVVASAVHGAFQWPTDLVRLGSALRADAVSFELRRGRWRATLSGAVLDRQLLELSVLALDPVQPTSARHRALSWLEVNAPRGWLSVIGSPWPELRIEAGRGVDRVFVRSKTGGAHVRVGTGLIDGARIEVSGLTEPASRALEHLAAASRFCPLPITVEGQPLAREAVRAALTCRITRPLPGALTLGDEEGARVWLLVDGLILTQLVVERAPAMDLALDVTSRLGVRTTAAELRALIGGQMAEIVRAVVDRAVERVFLSRRPPERERAALARLILEALQTQPDRVDLRALPLFRVLIDGAVCKCSLDELARSSMPLEPHARAGFTASEHRAVLDALDPDEDPETHEPARHVLLATERERQLVARALNVGVRSLARKPAEGLGARLSAFAASLADTVRMGLGIGRGRVVRADAMSRDEKALLAALRAVAPCGVEVELVEHAGGLVRSPSRIALPRRSAEVIRLINLHTRSPESLHAIALAVFRRPLGRSRRIQFAAAAHRAAVRGGS